MLMSYIALEISDSPFDEPKRVLSFGKYKGWTVASVHREQPGYLQWCYHELGEPFKKGLNSEEFRIVLSDYALVCLEPDYPEKKGRYNGTWGDGALWCGTCCEADTF